MVRLCRGVTRASSFTCSPPSFGLPFFRPYPGKLAAQSPMRYRSATLHSSSTLAGLH